MNKNKLLDLKSLELQPKELQALCKKLFSKGKSLRAELVYLVGGHLKIKEEAKLKLSRIVEYIHNSSLLHDDFIDHSLTRRSQQAAWLEFSPSQAVLAGDYLLSQVIIYLTEENNMPLFRLTAESISSLVKGEFVQRDSIKKNQNITLNELDVVSDFKTSSLFKWSLKACFLYQKKDSLEIHSTLNKIGYFFGILFQRSDDLMDFSIRNNENKAVLLDLNQGLLNSFATFLISNKNSDFKKQFSQIKNSKELHQLVPDIKNQIEAFDEINSKIIQQAEKACEELKRSLNPSEQKLADELKKLAYQLYWRK